MYFKVLLCFTSALLIQTISGQYIGNAGNCNNAINGVSNAEIIASNAAYGYPNVPEAGTAFNGGGFQVRSYSSIPVTGITVQSDNLVVEGPLAVSGQLPFLGVVAVEGPLAAAGQGAVTYSCGNGNVGIVSEGDAAIGAGAIGVSAGLTGLGYNGHNGVNGANGLGYNGPNGLGLNGAHGLGFNGANGAGCGAIY